MKTSFDQSQGEPLVNPSAVLSFPADSSLGNKKTVVLLKIPSSSFPLSERVRIGLEDFQRERFQTKPLWKANLSVLNEETIKLPLVKRKALATSKQLAEMPVRIRDYELIVGSMFQFNNITGLPFPRYWTDEEFQEAQEKFTHPFAIFGHFSPSYPLLLKHGVGGLRKIAEEKLAEARQKGIRVEQGDWYESVMMSLDGVSDFILRYRDLALAQAEATADAIRKGELKEIAAIVEYLAQEPPRTFREAVQLLWFGTVFIEATLHKAPVGRLDQYLGPYLEYDLERGTITMEQAQELVDLLWLKFNEQVQSEEVAVKETYSCATDTNLAKLSLRIGNWGQHLGGKTSTDRLYTDGNINLNEWAYARITLSGLTPEGVEGTNTLTYLCLNAGLRLELLQPLLHIRFHDQSPDELYQLTAECINRGIVTPTIYNDEVFIPAHERMGVPTPHARDYNNCFCWETYSGGRTNFKYGILSAVEPLDRVLHPAKWEEEVEVPFYKKEWDPFRGFHPDPSQFHSFEEVMAAYKDYLDRLIKGLIESADHFRDDRLYEIAPLPLFSALMEGPLECGRDITQDGVLYNQYSPLLGGFSHAVDSLAAIKKLCFEEHAIAWPELLEAIRNNWKGKESLRQLVMSRVPAYGSDEDYADDIACEIAEYFVERVKTYAARTRNRKIMYAPGFGTFGFYKALGAHAGATADGRVDGQSVSSNASPSHGRASHGPTAAVNSYCKLPLLDLPCGAPLDLVLENRASLIDQLEVFLKTFIEKRGQILTMVINDCDTLRAAQREPEKYRNLQVRIGGWNVYFVDLTPEAQEWHIKKAETYANA